MDIRHLHGIQNRPENIQFKLQNAESVFLLLACFEVIQCDLQTMLHIAARFREAFAKVTVSFIINPGVVLGPVIQALLMNLRRKQFGQ